MLFVFLVKREGAVFFAANVNVYIMSTEAENSSPSIPPSSPRERRLAGPGGERGERSKVRRFGRTKTTNEKKQTNGRKRTSRRHRTPDMYLHASVIKKIMRMHLSFIPYSPSFPPSLYPALSPSLSPAELTLPGKGCTTPPAFFFIGP